MLHYTETEASLKFLIWMLTFICVQIVLACLCWESAVHLQSDLIPLQREQMGILELGPNS